MKKLLTLYLIVIFFPTVVVAQSETSVDSFIIRGKQQLRHAINAWQVQDLLIARAFFERLQNDPTYPWLIHYYIALVDYRLVTYFFSNNSKDDAIKYIDDGIEHLQACIKLNKNFAEAYGLLSTLYGNKIGINPMLGITLGPKSGNAMVTAIKLEPRNPRSYLISGWNAYFTPKIFGGGKGKAKKYFQQAITYFNSSIVEKPILPGWGRDEAYAWLGLIFMEENKFELAQENFEKALEINPDYGWVKNALLPDLKKRIEQRK